MAVVKGRGSAAGHLAVVAIVLAVMAPAALATSYVVGGAQKWNFPPSNDAAYYTDTWAAGQTFHIGDTLLFQYSTPAHDVVQYATQAEYTACAGAQVNKYTSGNDSVPLPTAGSYFYICSVAGHCAQGMKLAVTVVAAATPPTTTPTPSPSPTPSPPPTTSPPGTNVPPPPATTTAPPPNAASSGPVLSMACLFAGAFVAILSFLI